MRPMTLEEIINALAVDFRESPLRFNLEKLLMALSDLLDACAGLVSRNTKDEITILRLTHASVKEYLTDPKRSSHVLQAEISDYAGHYMIARTCIAYLCSFDDYDGLKSSPLAVYAAQNWHHHVNRYNLGSLESHNNGVQLQTPRDHRNDFLALFWVFWIPLGLILWLFQGIYESSQQRDSRELIIALMELLDGGSLQYTYMLRLRAMPYQMMRSRWFSTPDDMPPLTLSAHLGVLPAVHQLLEKGADVNTQDGWYGNALYAASDGGHAEIVRALLEKGADVNVQGGRNALCTASDRGHAEIVRALLEKGADLKARG
ncbi:ankyrin repeat-containing domain protein [Mycena leptocephala]|nr:ankyrin repeat-containing domain protein [Mycena leptocephala]